MLAETSSLGKSVKGASLDFRMLKNGRGPTKEEFVKEFALTK